MKYLHYEFNADSYDVIQVRLDKQANVRLMDSVNFYKFRRGQQYRYYGGSARVSPVNLRPPHQGHWHVIIDLGGYPGTVRASAQVIRG